jgi:glucose-6-phosphate 1-dehydrogenase
MAASTSKAPEMVPENVVEKVEAEVEADIVTAENVVYREFVAIRDFCANHLTQLLSFKKGDPVTGEVGERLYATGAPLKPVETDGVK